MGKRNILKYKIQQEHKVKREFVEMWFGDVIVMNKVIQVIAYQVFVFSVFFVMILV